jgi:serine-type D-Ala-D-Ala carboxypeptidase/endopeptidase (penicillin-binding protein 4)
MIRLVTVFLLFTTTFIYASDPVRDKINSILSRIPSSTKGSVLIYNPMDQDTLFSINHTIPMIPASNTKLFTTAVALSLLGGDFEMSSKILVDENSLSNGSVNGNIYFKGFGNPLFTEGDMSRMVDELLSRGIRNITGDVIGDDSYFDEIYSRDDWIHEEAANVKLPPVSAIVIDRNRKVTYRKIGKRTRSYTVNVDNPPLYAAQLLKEKLSSAGISVQGRALKGITPSGVRMLSERKVLLKDVIKYINKNSDNFLAECLFKTIGAEASKIQGNSFYSTQAILNYIEDNGIFQQGTAIVDGSGISRFDQVTTGAITGLLERVYFDISIFDDYYNSLSIGGVDGTLRNRFYGTPAHSNFHGKTGTLNGVSSVSGYLRMKNGDDIIISIIFEFSRGGANLHKSIQDDIIEYLSRI